MMKCNFNRDVWKDIVKAEHITGGNYCMLANNAQCVGVENCIFHKVGVKGK